MVSSNTIVNFLVTPQDKTNSDKIFRTNAPSMTGKSVRRHPEDVVFDYVEIPKDILSMDTGLEVSVDVMLVNKLEFLVSVSKQLKFTTIQYIPIRSEKELARSVKNIIDVY